jgi:hypothetical protein
MHDSQAYVNKFLIRLKQEGGGGSIADKKIFMDAISN